MVSASCRIPHPTRKVNGPCCLIGPAMQLWQFLATSKTEGEAWPGNERRSPTWEYHQRSTIRYSCGYRHIIHLILFKLYTYRPSVKNTTPHIITFHGASSELQPSVNAASSLPTYRSQIRCCFASGCVSSRGKRGEHSGDSRGRSGEPGEFLPTALRCMGRRVSQRT